MTIDILEGCVKIYQNGELLIVLPTTVKQSLDALNYDISTKTHNEIKTKLIERSLERFICVKGPSNKK